MTSAARADDQETPAPRGEPKPQLRPFWLRPFSTALVVTAYGGAIACCIGFVSEKVTPLNEITVALIPQGETVTETSTVAAPESAPKTSPDPAVLAAPNPDPHDDPDISQPMQNTAVSEPVPELVAPAPKVEAPDAPALSIEHPQPRKIDKTKAARNEPSEEINKTEQAEAKRRAALRALKRAKAEAHARQQAERAQQGAPAVRTGVKEGTGEAQHMSDAAYAALVSAEINRHKHYPPGARENGATGRVGVTFSINGSGAIIAHSITKSSGNGAIDAEVHQMMAATHPPPPPGGGFHGSVIINFSLVK